MPRSSKVSLISMFPHQNSTFTTPLPHTCHMPRPLHPSRLDHSDNIW
jgi:hypothetical protein